MSSRPDSATQPVYKRSEISTPKDPVSKSWTKSRAQEVPEPWNKTTSKLQDLSGVQSSCAYCSSWINSCDALKTKVKISVPRNNPDGKRYVSNMKHLESPTTVPNPHAPHLKYGIFSPSRNRPKSPMKHASKGIRRDSSDAIKEASGTGSPYFSVRPLDQWDLETASQAERRKEERSYDDVTKSIA